MPLPLFLRKLTAPIAVKQVLAALDDEKRRIESMDASGPSSSSFGFDIVKSRVVENIFKWSANIQDDVAKGKSPTAVALWLMMNVARDDLHKGRHHLFPGRLSMPGIGVHALNNYCCEQLEKIGQISVDEMQAMIQATRDEVRGAG